MKKCIRAAKRRWYEMMWHFCHKRSMKAKSSRSTMYWAEQMLEYDVKSLLV